MQKAARTPFDDRKNMDASLDDLSLTLVRRYLDSVGSSLLKSQNGKVDERQIYRQMRISAPVNGHEAPRNVGLLFFSEDPERFFPGTRIEVAQFSEQGEVIEERSIRGPLDLQVREAIAALNSIVKTTRSKISGQAEVARTVEYPYAAMEEAIVNAVYHRSYDSQPEPIKIYLKPDRLEIISYPGPVPGIELHHLKSPHIPPPVPAKNRRIGDLLRELRLAEGRGTGLPTIRRSMKENGSPEPVFDFDEGRSYFRATLPVHPQYQTLNVLREATLLWATGEKRRAAAVLQDALEVSPTNASLAGQAIDFAFSSNQPEAATEIVERFRRAHGTIDPDVALRYATGLLNLGESDKALEALRDVGDPEQDSAQYEVAILRKRANDFEGAHRMFLRLAQSGWNDPKYLQEFAQVKVRLAQAAYRGQDRTTNQRLLGEAKDLLLRALQLAEDPVRVAWCWFDIARIRLWLREPTASVDDAFREAIKLLPNEPVFVREYERFSARR